MHGLLSILIVGNIGTLLIPNSNSSRLRQFSLGMAYLAFVWSLILWIGFDYSIPKFQYTLQSIWMPFANTNLILGLDSISLLFILLTTLIFPLCFLSSWFFAESRAKTYLLSFFFMELILILVFSSLDVLFFYVFFEAILVPMFLVIGIYGSRDRKIGAAYLFFMYTLVGSLFMLLGVIYLIVSVGSSSYESTFLLKLPWYDQNWLWFAFFLSLSAKIPMLPVHIWLPEAHVEAPTAGSVVLAGILLKLGSYGFVRFSLGLFPSACDYFAPSLCALGMLGIIYASFSAIRQCDMKRLIAYTSVAHMNLVLIGLFTNDIIGIKASIFQSLSHGFVSSGLFLCIGSVYDRWHTRNINYYGGLVQMMPIFTVVFLIFTLANLGLPGTSNFVGEFLLLNSLFQVSPSSSFLAATSVILAGAYSLWLFNRVSYGNSKLNPKLDLSLREFMVFFPLVLGTFYLGLNPSNLFSGLHSAVSNIYI